LPFNRGITIPDGTGIASVIDSKSAFCNPSAYTYAINHCVMHAPCKHHGHARTKDAMKKRCFTRYDAHIDARYCADDTQRDWRSCLITKISRKGLGVMFPADKPLPGLMLTFSLPTAQESEAVLLQGVLKWTRQVGGSAAGGIELNAIVGEAQWLQLIYFIRRPGDQNQFVSPNSVPDHRVINKNLHPAPAKVVVSTTTAFDHIRNILNYKIL
jgi:hypothetical protein